MSGFDDGAADTDVVHDTTNSAPELDSAIATQSSNTLVDGLSINSSASLRRDELLHLNAALAAAVAFAPLSGSTVAAVADDDDDDVDDDASGSAVATVDDHDDGDDHAVSTNAAVLVENQAQAADEDDDVVAVFVDNDDDDNDDVGLINHTDVNADDAHAFNDVSNDVHATVVNGLVGDVIGDNDEHDDNNNNNNTTTTNTTTTNTNTTNNDINDDDDSNDDVEVISSSSVEQRKRKGRTSPTSKKRKSQPVAAAGEDDADDHGDAQVETSEDQHEVERVVGKRIGKGGRLEYKVKWVGWADRHNSWEPLDCLNCPNLITAYENELLRALEGGYALDALGKPMVGFAHNHTIASMLGAKFEGDDIYILCRWEGVSAYTFESSRVLREKVPMKLLDFYESRIRIADSTRLRRNPSDPMPAGDAAPVAAVGAPAAEEGGAAVAAEGAGEAAAVAVDGAQAAPVDGSELAAAGDGDGGDDSVAWHDPQVSHVQARLAPSLVASHLAALNNS